MKTGKIWAAIAICAVACTSRPNDHAPAPRPTAASPSAAGAGIALDLASVMRRAHHRFRPDGDGFVSHGARVDATGALTVGSLRLSTLGDGGRAKPASDGGVDTVRDRCVTEHAAGTDEGIEQSWSFGCAPADGDVVIRVAASGFTGSDERGLRFGDMRYGMATWVDARGMRASVRPTWENGTITLRVPADVVSASAFPAVLDPLVSSEVALDTPVLVTALSTQDHTAIAFNGTSYLVVWDDLRNGGYDVYGARVDPTTGLVVSTDKDGIAIATGLGSQRFPAVASNGTDFLVVWANTLVDSTKIYGARVTAAGAVTDATGFAIGGGPGDQSSPSVAWDGTNYFVVWEDNRSNGVDVFGARVGTDGKTVAADAAAGIAVDTAISAQTHPRVACDGTRCLVVWTDNRGADYDIYGTRVTSATGAVGDAEPSPLPIAVGAGSATNPSITHDGAHGNYLVAWDDFSGGAVPDIRGRRIADGTGASLDATPIAIATGPQPQRASSLAFDGTSFLASWTDASGAPTIFGALIGADGSRITAAPDGIQIGATSVAESGSAVAGGKAGFYAAWTELSATKAADIDGTRVDPTTGTPKESPRVVLTGHANAEMFPAVASNGTDYFVVWEDWRSAAPGDVYGVRVGADGKVPSDDQAGVLIAVAAPAGSDSNVHHVQPAIAYGGGTYLVSWTDRRPPPPPETAALVTSVYALRVDPTTGRPIAADATGVRVSGTPAMRVTQTTPVLAFTGGTFLAAWRDARNGPESVYARTIKVDPSGLTLGDELRLGGGIQASTAPTIAGDGDKTFLVAWQDFRDGLQFRAYAARVDTSGKLVADDAAGFPITEVAANQLGPAAAWSGSEFFVAWEDHRSHNAGGEIFGRRVPKSGPPAGDDIPIATGTGGRETPAIADTHDGAPGGNLQIVWRDDRNGQWDIYGSLVSAGGLVREPAGLGIALEPGEKASPAVAALGNGDLLVAYSRLDPAPNFGVVRARARVINTGQKSGTCTQDQDCASRFCTDGQCCDARCDNPCRACGTGECKAVTSGQDDHCNGISSCSAAGECIRANGQPCQVSSECASGVCDREDGVCCDRACDGECNTCKSDKAPGICSVLIAGTAPVNCLPFACDGKNEQCPTKCEGDIQCARPNVCLGDGSCQAITAPTCIDTHTLKAPSGLVTECAPYACTGSSCVSKCKSLADCVNGNACDVDGVCRQPALDDATGGCACRAGRAPASGDLAWLALAVVALRRMTSRKRSRAARDR